MNPLYGTCKKLFASAAPFSGSLSSGAVPFLNHSVQPILRKRRSSAQPTRGVCRGERRENDRATAIEIPRFREVASRLIAKVRT